LARQFQGSICREAVVFWPYFRSPRTLALSAEKQKN
jgi:hypothetical protein